MQKNIPDCIAESLENHVRVITPTKACALFYRMYLLQTQRCTVLRKNAITTIEELTREKTLRPVTQIHRILFALQLLEDQSLERELTLFFELSTRAHTILIHYLVDLLPHLTQCAQHSEFVRVHPWITEIDQQYRSFLGAQQLSESSASFDDPSPPPNIAVLLPKLSPEFDTSGIGLPSPKTIKKFCYASFDEECHATFLRIAELIHIDTALHDIVITSCNLSAHLETITHIAELYNVPIHIVQAQKLSMLPGSRIIQLMDTAVHNHFDIESCAALLLDSSIPWKNPGELHELIRIGLEHDCRENELGNKRWEFILSHDKHRSLLKRYSSIYTTITTMYEAPSLDILYETFMQFLDEQWSTAVSWAQKDHSSAFLNIRFLQRQLEECVESIRLCDAQPLIAARGAWQTFMLFYMQLSFVHEARQSSILIYAYPVSVGIAPKHHFLLNQNYLDSFALRYAVNTIPENILQQFPIKQQAMTDIYAEYYRLCGDTLYMSYNTGKKALGGIPNALFTNETPLSHTIDLWDSLVERIDASHERIDTSDPASKDTDPQNLAEAPTAYRIPVALLQSMQSYAHRMRNMHHWKIKDFHRYPLSTQYLDALSDSHTLRSSSPLAVNDLNSFIRTPYTLFWQRLGLELDIPPLSLFAGSIYHSLLYTCLQEEMCGVLDEQSIPSLERIGDVLGAHTLAHYTLFSAAAHRFMTHAIQGTLLFLARLFADYRVADTEVTHAASFPAGKLSGRIDLILQDDAKNTAIIDFKTRSIVERKSFQSIHTQDDIHDFDDFQIPCYMYFLRDSHLIYAGYVSIEKKDAKHTPVFSMLQKRRANDSDQRTGFFQQFSSFLDRQFSALNQGNYACPPQGCAHCPMPSVCRTYVHNFHTSNLLGAPNESN